MKRVLVMFLTLALFLSLGCAQAASEAEPVSFCFPGTAWGMTWEEVQQAAYTGVEAQVSGAQRQVVSLSQIEWLDTTVDVRMQFDAQDSRTPGLCNVYVIYREEDEQALIEKLEALYGEGQDGFLDENGVINPLHFPSWAQPQSMKSVLSEEEMAFYQEMCRDIEQSRVDAILRQPLAIISLYEEDNLVCYQGNTAAAVKYIQNHVSKSIP